MGASRMVRRQNKRLGGEMRSDERSDEIRRRVKKATSSVGHKVRQPIFSKTSHTHRPPPSFLREGQRFIHRAGQVGRDRSRASGLTTNPKTVYVCILLPPRAANPSSCRKKLRHSGGRRPKIERTTQCSGLPFSKASILPRRSRRPFSIIRSGSSVNINVVDISPSSRPSRKPPTIISANLTTRWLSMMTANRFMRSSAARSLGRSRAWRSAGRAGWGGAFIIIFMACKGVTW